MAKQRVVECFDDLHFTECTFGKPSFVDGLFIIPVIDVMPYPEYPVANTAVGISGRLLFAGVSSSKRIISEYIENLDSPQGFKDRYEIVDIDCNQHHARLREYRMEG